MGHGGARVGAGKPKGATSKRNQETIEKALRGGITPLDVMLEAMRDAYNRKDLKEASNFAKDAAPYVHAKLQATTISGNPEAPLQNNHTINVKKLSDAALAEVLNAATSAD